MPAGVPGVPGRPRPVGLSPSGRRARRVGADCGSNIDPAVAGTGTPRSPAAPTLAALCPRSHEYACGLAGGTGPDLRPDPARDRCAARRGPTGPDIRRDVDPDRGLRLGCARRAAP